jgi:hypothetical protein
LDRLVRSGLQIGGARLAQTVGRHTEESNSAIELDL